MMATSQETMRLSTDWPSLRTEYINGSMQYKELAAKHGLKESTVRVRGHRDGWGEARNAVQQDVTRRATEISTFDRAAQLARFNEQDIKIAEAIKSKAAHMLRQNGIDDRVLANLTRIFDGAQKIGLLALGAATENHAVTTKELPSSVDDFV